MRSLDVRFTVECVFDGNFLVFDNENDIENAFDNETHIQTAHPKRKCNRPRNKESANFRPIIFVMTQATPLKSMQELTCKKCRKPRILPQG
jgi:uncharacterized protein YegL